MKVLFICTANVCRSPLAEGYLKHLLSANPIPGVEVESAGVMALSGSLPFECASEVAEMMGFDIRMHRARKLTIEIGQEADAIFCMETWQAKEVLKIDPTWIAKTMLLGNYHSSQNRLFQIPDPQDFTMEHTLKVFKLIQDSVERFHRGLKPANSDAG
jgi:protein-tyrosine-phosphatase